MDATRRARLESVIIEELSRVVPRELKDPRISTLTFTKVELNTDASVALVYFTLLGDPTDPHRLEKTNDCREGLTSASGFLRKAIAKVVTTRHIPSLIFKDDRGLENSLRVYELLKEIEQGKKPSS
jgi:ribosome-binding factor A